MKLTLDFKNPIRKEHEEDILKAWELLLDKCPPQLAETGHITIHYDNDSKQEGLEVFYGPTSSSKERVFQKPNAKRSQLTVSLSEVIKHKGDIFNEK